MKGTKRRPLTHVRGEHGLKIVRSRLPRGWVVREVVPDYGLDLHIEVFDHPDGDENVVEALGEHFFAQVKTVAAAEMIDLEVRPRPNVAKFPLQEHRPSDSDERKTIRVIPYSIETSEIATIESMGSSVPVLLILVDEKADTAYYVCLNDYISKVVVPQNPNYLEQKTITVHVPEWNRLDSDRLGFGYIRLLARRAKFYGAFSVLYYQSVEINYAISSIEPDEEGNAPSVEEFRKSNLFRMLKLFIDSNLRLDIWDPVGGAYWYPLKEAGDSLRALRNKIEERDLGYPTGGRIRDSVLEFLMEVDRTFKNAALLSRMYEELCREWRLPTLLADSMLSDAER